MNELKIGNQKFMGKEIPVLLGGFGENKKCISDKTIADVHDMKARHIRELVNSNIKRFTESVDFIDLNQRVVPADTLDLLQNLGYAKQSITQAEHIYILSERGYAKLIKIMDTDLAWDIHGKLIDEYFELRERKEIDTSRLSPELQMFKQIFDTVAATQIEQQAMRQAIDDTNKKVDNIKDIVALNPTEWRKDTSRIVNKIAMSMGCYEHVKDMAIKYGIENIAS